MGKVRTWKPPTGPPHPAIPQVACRARVRAPPHSRAPGQPLRSVLWPRKTPQQTTYSTHLLDRELQKGRRRGDGGRGGLGEKIELGIRRLLRDSLPLTHAMQSCQSNPHSLTTHSPADTSQQGTARCWEGAPPSEPRRRTFTILATLSCQSGSTMKATAYLGRRKLLCTSTAERAEAGASAG